MRQSIVLLALALAGAGLSLTPAADEAATPQPFVDTYSSLADTILNAKQTEWNLVHSMLAMTYRHAEGTLATAKAKLGAGESARKEIETLAQLVAQMGNEGDAAVAAIRKRLVEGGHHHNAAGERQGIYDEGYVIVTRQAKKGFLEAANRIGKMAAGGSASALEAEWQNVRKLFDSLHEGAAR